MARLSIIRVPVALVEGEQTLTLPAGADIKAFAYQDNVPWLWVEQDQDNDAKALTIALVRSAAPVPADGDNHDWAYRDSAVPTTSAGSEVWHLYEKWSWDD